MGDTMWWADVIGPDNMQHDCCGGGTTPEEAAATAWVEMCLGAWWCDCSDQSPEAYLDTEFRDLSKEEYLSVPRRVPECFHLSSLGCRPLSRGRKISNER